MTIIDPEEAMRDWKDKCSILWQAELMYKAGTLAQWCLIKARLECQLAEYIYHYYRRELAAVVPAMEHQIDILCRECQTFVPWDRFREHAEHHWSKVKAQIKHTFPTIHHKLSVIESIRHLPEKQQSRILEKLEKPTYRIGEYLNDISSL